MIPRSGAALLRFDDFASQIDSARDSAFRLLVGLPKLTWAGSNWCAPTLQAAPLMYTYRHPAKFCRLQIPPVNPVFISKSLVCVLMILRR